MTTLLLLALALLPVFAPQVRAQNRTRPVNVRIAWLQGRLQLHRNACSRALANSPQWHCKAAVWTRRELGEARAEQRRLIHRLRFRLPATGDWQTAVRVAQRVYPGTERWLLSCSHAEGGHGAWVRYGGGPYYPGYERTDAVGGWMQFRPSTFYAYVDRAVSYARAHGYTVPASAGSWLSPLGQALTAGYMRSVAQNSHWHWAASIDRGCA